MIAVISSTIAPPPILTYDGQRSFISPEERLNQTKKTIQSLQNVGINEIYLGDNSGEYWSEKFKEQLSPAKVFVFGHYQFQNRGISELFLLKSLVPHLPEGKPIVKISGRYILKKDLSAHLKDADLAVKGWKFHSSYRSMSTCCYAVKNKDVFDLFIQRTLREMYAYPSRIIGPRSFFQVILNAFFSSKESFPYEDPPGSIEAASARVIKNYSYQVTQIDELGIEGYQRGNPKNLVYE